MWGELGVGEVGGRRVLRARTVKNIDIRVAITGTSYLRLLPFGFACFGSWGWLVPWNLSLDLWLEVHEMFMRFIALCNGRREKNKVPLTENSLRSVEHSEELQYSHQHYTVCQHLLYRLLSWQFVLFLG